MRCQVSHVIVICILLAITAAAGEAGENWGNDIPAAAKWELQMLGVTNADMLNRFRAQADKRVVTIGIVGQGGMSRSRLGPYLPPGSSFVYRSCPDFPDCDPHKNTHDNGQARVILALTKALGVRVRLASYQPGSSWDTVARELAAAGERCDIVICFQSFWGEKRSILIDAIASNPQALYLSPYVGYQNRPTSTCMQAASYKPWGEGLPHFVTCAPLARRSDGTILTPPARDERDTEIINFIAPSYHASGKGGTCPSAATTAGVAAYLYAAAPLRPTPTQVTDLLRRSVCVDEAALTSVGPFTAEHIANLRASIAELMLPGPGGPRKLDATGVLSLRQAFELVDCQATGAP